jgi:hypothetical protein
VIEKGGVNFGVVGVEVVHQHLVGPFPLGEAVVFGKITWHDSCLLSPMAGKGEKWDVCIHLMETRAQCALFSAGPSDLPGKFCKEHQLTAHCHTSIMKME